MLFILSFVISAFVLSWAFAYAYNDMGAPDASIWTETIADLNEYCRIQHAKAAYYSEYARIADSARREREALLFRALANSETVHQKKCADALARLGGQYMPLLKHRVRGDDVDSCLEHAIAFEARLRPYASAMIDRARQSRNRYAARILIWTAGGDLKHLYLLRHAKQAGADAPDGYCVCQNCGNIFQADYCPSYCPFCLTAASGFAGFGAAGDPSLAAAIQD